MRTYIDIDSVLLRNAMAELGTKTWHDTIHEALRRAAAPRLGLTYLDFWKSLDVNPVAWERERQEAWSR